MADAVALGLVGVRAGLDEQQFVVGPAGRRG